MRKILIAFLSCVLILLPLLMVAGQERGLIVSGTVTDANGNPLPGTNVLLRDYGLGAASDMSGKYQFTIPAKYMSGDEVVLLARFIGYHTKAENIVLSPGTKTVDFVMQVDVLEMDAVVVTGVAEETPKVMLPFTVDRVSKEAVEMVPAVSAVGGLQGKVAGVTVVQGSGRPGDAVSVRMRAANQLLVGNTPLFIVDGVILGANQVDIDALDIETIEIVKGPAAASLYGSRAANGVIQIKTKRGNTLGLGETRIKIRNEFGFSQLAKEVDLNKHHFYRIDDQGNYLDADGNVTDYLGAAIDEDHMQDNPFPGTHYDHLDMYFDPGSFYTNTVTLSQHSPTTNYFLSLNNLQESGIMVFLKGYNRKNMRLNLDHKIREGLNLSVSSYYANSHRDDPQTAVNPFYSLMFINPNVDLEERDEDGDYRIQPDARTLEENPLYALKTAEEQDKRSRVMGSFTLRYAPVTWFNVEGNFSYDRSDRNSMEYYKKGYKHIDAVGLELGRYIKTNAFDQAMNAGITASLYKSFGDFYTRTKIRALYENTHYDYTYTRGDNLGVNDVRDFSVVEGDKIINSTIEDIRSIGYYFISSLEYKEKYIVDLLFRYDGSSLFGENERWHPYYRGSAAWRVAQEPFWPLEDVTEFKLRYSYGTAGSRPGFAYQYETFNVAAGIVSKANLGNKLLKPSFSTEQEVGLEITFLDRFSLEGIYSHTLTEDQLLLVPLAGYYGFSNQYQNAGTVKSTVWEANLNAFIISKRDMSWSAGVVFDRYRSKITELDVPAYRTGPENAFYIRKDEEFGAMYAHKFMKSKDELDTHLANDETGGWAQYVNMFDINDDGYLVPVGEGNTYKDGLAKDLWGTYVDLDGDGSGDLKWGLPVKYVTEEDGDFHKVGSVIPDFNLGFNSTFRWKGFKAYILLGAQIGGDIYNETRQWPYRELRHGDCDQSGKSDELKKPYDYYAELYNVNANCNHFVEDGTYVKLRELSLQYTFDRAHLGFLSPVFHRITLGVIGRNLLTFTDYSGWDPEIGQSQDNTGADQYRVDNFNYPKFRTITGILEIEF